MCHVSQQQSVCDLLQHQKSYLAVSFSTCRENLLPVSSAPFEQYHKSFTIKFAVIYFVFSRSSWCIKLVIFHRQTLTLLKMITVESICA